MCGRQSRRNKVWGRRESSAYPRSTIPLLKHSLHQPSAFSPHSLIAAVREERGLKANRVPAVCVLEFDGDLTDWLLEQKLVAPCLAWACFHTTMFELEADGTPCGVIPRTIGGPYAVLVAEQLFASGARVVLGLTTAGRVQPSLTVPALVVATSAVRDEGTSYHYLKPAPTVDAPTEPVECLIRELNQLDLPVMPGQVWTTDAPYRETEQQLNRHARGGVLAVEMQAASLFAFAEARRATVGVVAHVTNAVDLEGEAFNKGSQEDGLRILQAVCRAGLQCLEVEGPDEIQPRGISRGVDRQRGT